MTRALIIQHQHDAPGGLLLALEIPWEVVRVDLGEPLPDPAGVEIAVSLGSDAAADDTRREWIPRELAWLRSADAAGTRILGLCFGAQALACALGGGVRRAAVPERDWVLVDTRAPELIEPGPWLAWHDDVIGLPPNAELLADNACGPQAYRVGRHLGLQFHAEVTREIVTEWVSGSRDALLDGPAMLAATEREHARAELAAGRLFRRFAGDA